MTPEREHFQQQLGAAMAVNTYWTDRYNENRFGFLKPKQERRVSDLEKSLVSQREELLRRIQGTKTTPQWHEHWKLELEATDKALRALVGKA